MRIEAKLRSTFVEGICVFLSLFDDNPKLKHIFCPPKECYDPEAEPDGATVCRCRRSVRLIERERSWRSTSRSRKSRTSASNRHMLKQDFQRAMLNRIPEMEKTPEAALSRAAVSLRRVPGVRHGGRDRIRPATRSSSPCPARPNASQSSRRKASAR